MLQVVNSYRESYACMIPLRAFDSPANQLEARDFFQIELITRTDVEVTNSREVAFHRGVFYRLS